MLLLSFTVLSVVVCCSFCSNNYKRQSLETSLRRWKRFIGAPMGVLNSCDDAQSNLAVDWNGSPDEYTCIGTSKWIPQPNIAASLYEMPGLNPRYDPVLHICMNERIFYDFTPPLRGPHRPNWAQYGEYLYVPPQRWLHNLEHGSIILLYHPCANDAEVDKLRTLVRSCVYRHVITPYNRLSMDKPLALVSWGAKLEMNVVDQPAVVAFIKAHARRAPEDLSKQGQYVAYLTRPAQIVSDINDSNMCPWAG